MVVSLLQQYAVKIIEESHQEFASSWQSEIQRSHQ
jgi:hypothetical protein